MKNIKVTAVYGVLGVLALVSLTQGSASATLPDTATFDLTGVNGLNLAGVYTSPYIGGTAGTDPQNTGPVICDDFSDNSYIPEEWTTYVTSMSNGVFGPTDTSVLKWKGADSGGAIAGVIDPSTGNPYLGWNLNQAVAYDVAADLVLKILAANPTIPSNTPAQNLAQQTAQEDLSFALWELFAPNVSALNANKQWELAPSSDAVVPWLSVKYNLPLDLSAATGDVEAAIKEVTTSGFTGLDNDTVFIYSYNQDPTATKCGTGACSTLPPQEFISVTTGSNQIPVPEASIFDTFSLYFLAGGAGLVFLSRRKIFRTQA